MRNRLLTVAVACCLFAACQQGGPQPPAADRGSQSAGTEGAKADLPTDESKTIYAMGYELSKMISPYNLSEADLQPFVMGITDGIKKNDPQINLDEFGGPKFAELAKKRAAGAAEAEKKASQPFLEKMAAEPGANKTASGLIYIELSPGSGKQPTAEDQVKVHYTGTLIDGTVFDSSVNRGTPATFPLKNVIPCWTEGLQLMKEGGKAKLICPPEIAYGDQQKGPMIKPGSTLVFEVELLEVLPQG